MLALSVLAMTSDRRILPIQPFHKLTQWLAYSLTSVIQRLLNTNQLKLEILDRLPENNNGSFLLRCAF